MARHDGTLTHLFMNRINRSQMDMVIEELFINIKPNLKVITFPEAIATKLKEIEPKRRIKGKVSYHDPCGLSRYNFVTSEPRKIIKMIVEEYEERGPSGRDQLCCGGGGGVSFAKGLRSDAIKIIGPKKVNQFKGVDLVITSCAKCKSMLLTYSLLYRGGFRVHRLSYSLAWSLGLNVPPP